MPNGLTFKLIDYLDLVDWTGRILLDDKRGAMPYHVENLPTIENRPKTQVLSE